MFSKIRKLKIEKCQKPVIIFFNLRRTYSGVLGVAIGQSDQSVDSRQVRTLQFYDNLFAPVDKPSILRPNFLNEIRIFAHK